LKNRKEAMSKIKISAVIITKNEEKNITRCLNSLIWADEILVVDSGSTDKTIKICEKYDCNILSIDWMGFGPTKKFAVDNAKNDWVFSIDADEAVTEELRIFLENFIDVNEFNGYRIKRKSIYLGKTINHSGWDNDFPLRFFNKKYGNYNDKLVHEAVDLSNKKVKSIVYPIMHYPYPSISSHILKLDMYSNLGAEQALDRGQKCSILFAMLSGFFKFFKMYILKKGFLDGSHGFCLAIISSFGVTIKYLKIWSESKK